jgi:hypothetical protein
MKVVPDEHILLFSEQIVEVATASEMIEVAKASDLTGETPDTICNFIRQHPGVFSDAMAAIMAGVDLAPYRDDNVVR